MFIDKSLDKQKEHFKYGINQWTGEPNKPVFYNKEMAQKVREIKRPVTDLMMDYCPIPRLFSYKTIRR
jgi:hypothetical protein